MLSAASDSGAAGGPPAARAAQSGEGDAAVTLLDGNKDGSNAHTPERAGTPRKTLEKSLTLPHDSWASPDESWARQPSATPEQAGNPDAAAAAAAASERPSLLRVAAEAATAAYASGAAPRASAKFAATAALADAEAAHLLDTCGDNDFHPVFVFTNPTSGGNKAAAFTKTAVSRLTLAEPYSVEVFIFDIREGLSGMKPGFLLLKAVAAKVAALEHGSTSEADGSHERNTVRILVAGGDGTVMWCLDEMKRTGVNGEVCAVGVVPYGTGNDFANAFGWRPFNAANPFDASLQTLRVLLDRCMRAVVVYHDLWEIRVSLKPGGLFTKINSATKEKEVLKVEGLPVEELVFTMSNYFSMGVESRIGRGFDRHRTKSQTLNKVRYGLEGFKKTFVKRTKNINQTVADLVEKPGTPEEHAVFTTNKDQAKEKQIPLLKKAASLIVLNIPSFSGGNDIWAPSKRLATSLASRHEQKKAKELIKSVPQQMGDEKLEFMTFRDIPSMGMEFMIHGRGYRLHSGRGPWQINFKPLDEKTRVYFQTDGEFFQMTLPATVTLAHDRRVRVLSLKALKSRGKETAAIQ